MKRQDDVIIELGEKATQFAIKNENLVDIDFDHLPFTSFTFFYPMSCLSGDISYSTLQEIASYTGLTNLDPIRLNLIKKELLDRKSYVTVDILSNKMLVSVQDDDREPLIEFEVHEDDPKPVITYNFLDNGKFNKFHNYIDRDKLIHLALSTTIMIFNVLGYIVKPNLEVVKKDRPVQDDIKHSHKRVPYKSNKQVRYLTKKVYVVDDMEHYATQRTNRTYNRYTETWTVRGHWRQYKSGKRVWIEKSVRGNKDKQAKPQTYKITKMGEE